MSGRTRIAFAAVVAALTLAVVAAPASAATLNVCPSGCTFTTIQGAITAAGSGDTIRIAAGTYTEQLDTIDKSLSLVGAGAATTTIDGNHSGRVVLISSGSVKISGVTISGGIANDGGGIWVGAGVGTVTLKNSRVEGNEADSTGGIVNNSTMTLTNTTVSHNTATAFGNGGILNTGVLTLNNSTVSENTDSGGEGGGGIFNIGTATLNNSKVTGNATSGSFGGGGILNFGTATLNNSKVTGNTASTGSGGGILTLGTVTLKNSKVTGNCLDDIDGTYTQKNSKVGPPGPC